MLLFLNSPRRETRHFCWVRQKGKSTSHQPHGFMGNCKKCHFTKAPCSIALTCQQCHSVVGHITKCLAHHYLLVLPSINCGLCLPGAQEPADTQLIAILQSVAETAWEFATQIGRCHKLILNFFLLWASVCLFGNKVGEIRAVIVNIIGVAWGNTLRFL